MRTYPTWGVAATATPSATRPASSTCVVTIRSNWNRPAAIACGTGVPRADRVLIAFSGNTSSDDNGRPSEATPANASGTTRPTGWASIPCSTSAAATYVVADAAAANCAAVTTGSKRARNRDDVASNACWSSSRHARRAATSALAAVRRCRRCWRLAAASIDHLAHQPFTQRVGLLSLDHGHHPVDLIRVLQVAFRDPLQRVPGLATLDQRVNKLRLGPVLDVPPQDRARPALLGLALVAERECDQPVQPAQRRPRVGDPLTGARHEPGLADGQRLSRGVDQPGHQVVGRGAGLRRDVFHRLADHLTER